MITQIELLEMQESLRRIKWFIEHPKEFQKLIYRFKQEIENVKQRSVE